MAIQFDADSLAYVASGNTLAWSHTVGSGNNRLLVVVAPHSASAQGSVNGITFDGTPLLLARGNLPGIVQAEIWYLINPSSGTGTITITYSGYTSGDHVARAASFFNTRQSGVLGNSSANTGTSAPISGGPTTLVYDSLLIDCVVSYGGALTPTAGQTSIGDLNQYTNRLGSWRVVGAAGAYANTWDWGAGDTAWALAVAEFMPFSPPVTVGIPQII